MNFRKNQEKLKKKPQNRAKGRMLSTIYKKRKKKLIYIVEKIKILDWEIDCQTKTVY